MKTLSAITVSIMAATLLAGCNNSNSESKKTTDKVIEKPKADYEFSDDKKDKILESRYPLTQAVSLQINNEQFNQTNFVHKEQNYILFELESDENKLTFMLANGKNDNDNCIIYHSKQDMEVFKCNEKHFSVSDDSSVLQNSTTTKNNSVSVEYQNEILESGESLGSTLLTFKTTDDGNEIITSFAFEEFTQHVLCDEQCEQVNYSSLGASTFVALEDLQEEHDITKATLVFNNPIGGSADDEINLYTGILIRDNQLNTKVSKTGSVFSGGTDLFAAGVERILEVGSDKSAIDKNKQIGVHSWSDGEKSAKDYPYTNAMHRMQATYTNKMLGDKGIPFYLFTLDAAPASGAHYMTKDELTKYTLVTQFIN